jgi:hypothetical protein
MKWMYTLFLVSIASCKFGVETGESKAKDAESFDSIEGVKAESEFAGAWVISVKEPRKSYEFLALSTGKTLSKADRPEIAGELYEIIGGEESLWKHLVAFRVVNIDGRRLINWLRMAAPNNPDVIGNRLDGEGTYILAEMDGTYFLGGDRWGDTPDLNKAITMKRKENWMLK